MNSLQDVLNQKAIGNAFLKDSRYHKAELVYKKIIEGIDNLLKNENVENRNEIIEQKKLIMSNLALSLKKQYNISEAMKYDRIIIKKLDPKFAKSYARLIEGYMDYNQLTMARYHYDLMKANVDQETIDMCSEVINKLKEKLKEKDKDLDHIMNLKNIFKKEN